MRELVATHQAIANRVDKLEHRQERTISVLEVLVGDIDRLEADVLNMKAPAPLKKKRHIGFGS